MANIDVANIEELLEGLEDQQARGQEVIDVIRLGLAARAAQRAGGSVADVIDEGETGAEPRHEAAMTAVAARRGRGKGKRKPGQRNYTPAQKAEQARKMRLYWAKRKREAAGKKGKGKKAVRKANKKATRKRTARAKPAAPAAAQAQSE